MVKKETYGSVKRLGVRYGRTVRFRMGKIEKVRAESTKCPFCHYNSVKRASAGIWDCKKCGSKFTGRAYDFSLKSRPVKLTEEAVEVEEETQDEVKTA